MDDFKRGAIAASGDGGDALSAKMVSGKRSSARSTLVLSAQVRLDTEPGTRDVRVRNLSEGGLMVELDRLVPVGATIWVDLKGIGEVSGKVAWCTQGRVGVALDEPIDPGKAQPQAG